MAKDRRKKILKAVERMVRNRRFHEITMDEVAAAAGVGKGTIYRYFKDKNDLFFQLATAGFDELCQLLRKEPAAGQSFDDRLLEMCTQISNFFGKRHALMRVIQNEGSRMEKGRCERRKMWREKRRGVYDAVRDTLAEGAAGGIIREDIPLDNQATLLLGMLRHRGLAKRQSSDPEFSIENVVSLFLEGACQNRKGDA